ncbi:alpha/beta-hydrolase [Whalleya microplaca]|nr:alpha/beta-hydrolase [Whalleya microplaca]
MPTRFWSNLVASVPAASELTMDKPITTTDVPPQFLNAAFLLGHIPQKALASDPRVSYTLYVPPEHYNPNAASTIAKLSLLVSLHGSRRDISDIDDLVTFAKSTPCAVLVPLFPAGLDGPNDIDSYKLLRSKTLRSDLALLAMLDEITYRWPGIETDKVFLMGFSGGGQFAHRFLYLYPERLAAISIGAPGSVTLLDDQQNWPAGIKDVEYLFGKVVQKDLIRKIPIQLVVGGADVKVPGGEEFWVWLQEMKGRHKGNDGDSNDLGGILPIRQGRVQTIQNLRGTWKENSIETQMVVVDGVAHNAKGVRKSVLEFLRPWINKGV